MMLNAPILSHMYRGIFLAMTRIIARVTLSFTTNPRNQSLGLGPVNTRMVNYLEIDLAEEDLIEVSTSTILVDPTFF